MQYGCKGDGPPFADGSGCGIINSHKNTRFIAKKVRNRETMHREKFGESVVKGIIFILFTVTLLCTILFWWSAQSVGAAEATPTGAQQLASQQQVLLEQEALQEELALLEAQLAVVEQQLLASQQETESARQETENVLGERVMMNESVGFDYAGDYLLTAYCCETYPHICGGNGVTASGTVPTPGRTIAADWSLHPSGTWLYIEGVGLRRVEDTGSAIKGQKIDVAIDTHANALSWGGQGYHRVWVLSFDYM